jgi:hypothetical protein
MDSLPPVLLDFISVFRPLMRAEVFDSFAYSLWVSLSAKPSMARCAPVFLLPRLTGHNGYPTSFCRHTLSHQAFMANTSLFRGVSIELGFDRHSIQSLRAATGESSRVPFYTGMPAGAGPGSVSLRASVSIAETVSAESQARAASASSLRVRRYDARRA